MNVTYYLKELTLKRAIKKNSDYSPIIQGCMDTCIQREKFKNFHSLLESESISMIVMGKLKLKLK